jgi:hypothetical protein
MLLGWLPVALAVGVLVGRSVRLRDSHAAKHPEPESGRDLRMR